MILLLNSICILRKKNEINNIEGSRRYKLPVTSYLTWCYCRKSRFCTCVFGSLRQDDTRSYRKLVRIVLHSGSGYDIPHDSHLLFYMPPNVERFAGVAVPGFLFRGKPEGTLLITATIPPKGGLDVHGDTMLLPDSARSPLQWLSFKFENKNPRKYSP